MHSHQRTLVVVLGPGLVPVQELELELELELVLVLETGMRYR